MSYQRMARKRLCLGKPRTINLIRCLKIILVFIIFFSYQVQLPPYVTCTQCVIQWSYYTGNQWGACNNGTEAQGCGRSETFRNCADVAIHTSTG